MSFDFGYVLGSVFVWDTLMPPPLPPSLQIMVALRFYANGNFQAVAGDLRGISKASVSRIVNAVSSTLVALRRFAPEILVMSMIRKPLGYIT